MNKKLYKCLNNKYLKGYVITLSCYHLNAVLPAIVLAYGQWSAEQHTSGSDLAGALVFFICCYAAFACLASWNRKLLYKAVYYAGKEVRVHLFENMIQQREMTVDSSLLLNDVEKVEEKFYLSWIELVEQVLLFGIVFVVILFQNPCLAMILAAFSMVLIFVTRRGREEAMMLQQQNSEKQESLIQTLFQTNQGMDSIKVYKQQPKMYSEFHKKSFLLNTIQGKLSWSQEKMQIFSMAFLLAAGTLCMLAANHYIVKNQLTIIQLLLIIQLSNNLFKPLQKIIMSWYNLKSVKQIIKKIDTGFERETETEKKEDLSHMPFENKIDIHIPSFSIGEQEILHDVDFSFFKGQKVLLVGENGSGKSTLLKIMTGMFGYEKGTIDIDGTDCFEMKSEQVCSYFAPVDQKIFLFSDTVRGNVSCFQEISESELNQIAKITCLSDCIDAENANMLSGGQKQRIAIARALASKRDIVVLDEAFSAVDAEKHVEVEQALLKDKNLTIISITHHLTIESYMLYDLVVWMKNGSIQAKGTPKQMMEYPFVREVYGDRQGGAL